MRNYSLCLSSRFLLLFGLSLGALLTGTSHAESRGEAIHGLRDRMGVPPPRPCDPSYFGCNPFDNYHAIYDISEEGPVALTSITDEDGLTIVRWRANRGVDELVRVPIRPYALRLSAMSQDGTAFAATTEETVPLESSRPSLRAAHRPLQWSQTSGVLLHLQPLSFTKIAPRDLSDDASTIVATSYGPSPTSAPRPFRMTDARQIFPLPGLDGTPAAGTAERISGDGRIIVGTLAATFEHEDQKNLAVRWIDDGLPIPIIEETEEMTSTFAAGMSEDGSIVTGGASGPSGIPEAFVWSESAGIQLLGNLGGESPFSVAYDTTPDGRVVVGYAGASGYDAAFIWDREHGMRSLEEVLRERGIDLNGWQLWGAGSVSDDGRTIMGGGSNPNGDQDTFVVNLPREKPYLESAPKPCRTGKVNRRPKGRADSRWGSSFSPCRQERRAKRR